MPIRNVMGKQEEKGQSGRERARRKINDKNEDKLQEGRDRARNE